MDASGIENKILTNNFISVGQTIRLKRNEMLLLKNEHHKPGNEEPDVQNYSFLF